MGQKTNPISNRIGIIRGWDSNWYGDYASRILEDAKIREYLNTRLAKASLSKIVIERTLKLITVTIHTARPGVIIGKGGQEVDKLKEELKKVCNKEVQINIFEVKRPEVDANIVANNIARQVEGRVSYRRAVKMAIASTMRVGAEGIKVLSVVVSAVLKWQEASSTTRVVLLSTLSVLTLTMLWQRLTPRLVFSALKYGSATVRFMVNAISHLTRAFLPMQHQPSHRAVAVTVVVVADAVATVVVVADVPVNQEIASNKEFDI